MAIATATFKVLVLPIRLWSVTNERTNERTKDTQNTEQNARAVVVDDDAVPVPFVRSFSSAPRGPRTHTPPATDSPEPAIFFFGSTD